MALENFAFVLFKPKSAGNVGAAARALKNMGFRDLRIVDETRSGSASNEGKDRRAEIMAVHGRDVLASASIHAQLDDALADRTVVVGTTARTGPYRSEARPVREVSHELASLSTANRIALLFGPEDCGLTNEELKRCHRLITIPTAPAYPSLNLAQAVMIVAYELMMAAGAAREFLVNDAWAPTPEINAMLERITKALIAIGFLPEDNPDHIMFAIRAIFGRAGLRPRELDILNGIASQILWFAQDGHETLQNKLRAGMKFR
ncbi:MAG TPA: RNA methyltransferase [Candidatus Binataceae bacterium]|nr:RNA methyltransferase [Candidatus Binataceae bacterium]